MNDKDLRRLSPLSRRRLLTALAASPFVAAYGRSGLVKAVDMLFGSQEAYAAPNPIKYFIEINLRDQWDFMHFMVPPGLATHNGLIRAAKGEKGEEALCGLYQDPKTLIDAGNGIYLTNDSKDVKPHVANIAAVETIELCIGTIHGHEAANALRSPGRGYRADEGKTAMWLGDDATQQDAGGDEFLYSSSPTPAMVHLNLARQMNANARAVALKFLGRADKKHTVYHHAAGLSDKGFQRIQSREQLVQAFESARPVDPLSPTELQAMQSVLKRLDGNFLKRMRFTDPGAKSHGEHLEGFFNRAAQNAKDLVLTLTDDEKLAWGDGVPKESSGAPRMHLWEQAAIATKLLEKDAVSTVAMEFSFDDLHGTRPKNEVTHQGAIIGMVLSRLIAKLKSTETEIGNLFDNTLIMLNSTDGGRSPAVDSYGDSGKNSMILIGPGIKGGYYGDIRVAKTEGNAHTYSYHMPNFKTGQTETQGQLDNSGRIPGAVAYRTLLSAMGAPVDMLKSFPDVGEGERLSFMLK
jgi:hypothetical protein